MASEFNGNEAYQGAGGGQCNCVFGVKVDDDVFVVTMEGLECAGGAKADEAALDEVDFYLDMNSEDWKAMLTDIAQNGQPTLDYTLNTLDLARPEGLSTSKHGDQFREDLFFRYNQTLQFLFNASAKIKTTF